MTSTSTASQSHSEHEPRSKADELAAGRGYSLRRLLGYGAIVVFIAAILAAVGFALHGRAGIEKTLTKLALPVGGGWLLISSCVVYRLLQRRWRAALPMAAVWLALTLISTSPLADACLRYLETRETVYIPGVGEPLDAVLVLGGGTAINPHRSALSGSGDRVVLGAEMYLQGQVLRLLTSGSPLQGMSASGSQQTTEIWSKLGIPLADITALDARNTYEELAALKAWIEAAEAAEAAGGQEESIRVGVLTSAWHLPRAMRLARAQGIVSLAIAADYRSYDEAHFADRLPTARNLDRLAQALHEFLAAVVNR